MVVQHSVYGTPQYMLHLLLKQVQSKQTEAMLTIKLQIQHNYLKPYRL